MATDTTNPGATTAMAGTSSKTPSRPTSASTQQPVTSPAAAELQTEINSLQLDPSKVTQGKRLGAGAFATVYLGQYEGSKQKYVIKRLDRMAPDQMQQVKNQDLAVHNLVC